MLEVLQKIRLPEQIRYGGPFAVYGLAVFFIPLVFSLFTYENFETVKFALLLLFCGILVFTVARTGSFKLPSQKFFYFFLATASTFFLLSALFAQDKLSALIGLYPRLNNSLLLFMIWIIFILVGLSVLNRDRISLLVKIVCVVGFTVAVTTLIQNTGIGFYVSPEAAINNPNPRVPGILGNPNFTSMFLVMILPFLLQKFFQKNNGMKASIFYGSGLLLSFLTVAILSSRGALLGLLALLSFYLIFFAAFKKKKEFIWLLLISMAAVTISFTFLAIYRGDSYGKTETISAVNISTRLTAWNQTVKIISENPWFGVGPGNFHIAYEKLGSRDSHVQASGSFDDAHNILLHLAATSGIPFALAFLILITYTLYHGFKKLRQEFNPFIVATMAVILAFIAVGSFTPVPISAWLMLAVGIAGVWHEEEKEFVLKIKPAVKFIFISASVILVLFGLGFLTSEYLFYFSLENYNSRKYESSHYLAKAALLANPTNQYAAVYRAASAGKLNLPSAEVESYIKYAELLHPYTGRTYHQSGSLYWQLFVATADPKYAQLAVDSARKSILLNGLVPERNGELAYYFQAVGNIPLAMHYARNQLILSPKLIGGWIMLAKIYQVQGLWQQEKFAIKKAFEIEPTSNQLKNLWKQAKNSDGNNLNIQVLQTENFLD